MRPPWHRPIAPDTSPRNLGVPGEAESWDFGVGAGFYVDATQPTWKQWRMYSYVTKELPDLLKNVPELDVSRVRTCTTFGAVHHNACGITGVHHGP